MSALQTAEEAFRSFQTALLMGEPSLAVGVDAGIGILKGSQTE